jgi:large subunit ribosomal protein L25
MKSLTVKAHKREKVGKKEAKKLRTQGMIPGVLYGKDEVVHLTVSFSEIRKLIYTPNVYLINLDINGTVEKAIIQDLQWHPVDEQILHIDFIKIFEDKPVKIFVPIKIDGTAKGIKAGGRLKTNMRKLRIKALYENLPDTIDIDVTNLEIGDSIKVGDLRRDNLEFLDNNSNMIVGVISTRVAQAAMLLPEDIEEEETEAEEAETEEQEPSEEQ